jgi:uncharacterized phage-like protein YoqJ
MNSIHSNPIRPNLSRRVYHCAISLPIGETLNDATWRRLGRDYLQEMGFAGHQYLMVRHTDTEHEHIHIIANRVSPDGQTAADAWDYYRAQTVAQTLEQRYGLTPSTASWETGRAALTRRQLEKGKITGQRSVQEELQDEITKVLPDCHRLTEFIEQLAIHNIVAQITYGYDNQAIGISYRKGQVTMSGSRLGRHYTLNFINQRFQANELEQELLAESQVELVRQQITQTLNEAAQDHPTLSQLIERLDQEGIETHLQFTHHSGKSQKIQAIRFNQGHLSFLGQSLGNAYSLEGLQTELGVDYDPNRDHPWFQQWHDGLRPTKGQRSQVTKAHQVEQPAAPINAMQVILLSGQSERPDNNLFRKAMIGTLHQAFTSLLQQANNQGYERLQIITQITPGLEQWGTVTALKLQESQRNGEIAALPQLEIIALSHGINDEQWQPSQKTQYDRLLKAVDCVIPDRTKADYLKSDSIIIGSVDRLDAASRSLLQQSMAADVPIQWIANPRAVKQRSTNLERD